MTLHRTVSYQGPSVPEDTCAALCWLRVPAEAIARVVVSVASLALSKLDTTSI